MQLIGTLDSPYVRRVAISLQCFGLSLQHRSLSVPSAEGVALSAALRIQCRGGEYSAILCRTARR